MPDVDRALTTGHTYSDEKVALQLVIPFRVWFCFKEIPVDLNEPMTPVDETEAKDGLD